MTKHPDVAIFELAARQHGVVTRRQLVACGVTEAAIKQRLHVRRLRRIHSGVYAVGMELGLHATYLAAVLACGSGAVVSHRSAAALLGLLPVPAGPIDVTVPRRGTRRRPGIAIHTTRFLDRADVTVVSGVPCTATARTLLDVAGVVPRLLDRAIERAWAEGFYDHRAVDATLARARGRRGAGVLRRRIAAFTEPPGVRSELERRFLELVRQSGVPPPVVNGVVGGYEVDFHWPAKRLVVETDGRSWHDTPLAFERDRRRDLDLENAGWHVVRIGWRQVIQSQDAVAAVLRAHLGPSVTVASRR